MLYVLFCFGFCSIYFGFHVIEYVLKFFIITDRLVDKIFLKIKLFLPPLLASVIFYILLIIVVYFYVDNFEKIVNKFNEKGIILISSLKFLSIFYGFFIALLLIFGTTRMNNVSLKTLFNGLLFFIGYMAIFVLIIFILDLCKLNFSTLYKILSTLSSILMPILAVVLGFFIVLKRLYTLQKIQDEITTLTKKPLLLITISSIIFYLLVCYSILLYKNMSLTLLEKNIQTKKGFHFWLFYTILIFNKLFDIVYVIFNIIWKICKFFLELKQPRQDYHAAHGHIWHPNIQQEILQEKAQCVSVG